MAQKEGQGVDENTGRRQPTNVPLFKQHQNKLTMQGASANELDATSREDGDRDRCRCADTGASNCQTRKTTDQGLQGLVGGYGMAVLPTQRREGS